MKNILIFIIILTAACKPEKVVELHAEINICDIKNPKPFITLKDVEFSVLYEKEPDRFLLTLNDTTYYRKITKTYEFIKYEVPESKNVYIPVFVPCNLKASFNNTKKVKISGIMFKDKDTFNDYLNFMDNNNTPVSRQAGHPITITKLQKLD